MPEVKVKDSGIKDVEIFGEADKNSKGRITSEYPAFYFPQHKEELKGKIASTEFDLKMGRINESVKPQIIAELEKNKETLSKIEASTPNLSDSQRDALYKVSKELGGKISQTQPTRAEMAKGFTDPHEEVRRMSTPVVSIKSEAEYDLAKKLGINVTNDKVSRTDAEKMWKISRRILGESSNTEILRKDK